MRLCQQKFSNNQKHKSGRGHGSTKPENLSPSWNCYKSDVKDLREGLIIMEILTQLPTACNQSAVGGLDVYLELLTKVGWI